MKKTLQEQIIEEYGKKNLRELEIPSHITDNLSKELRQYQIEALRLYMANDDSLKARHLMFNMATGSGKTLIMAALMLDAYKKGYDSFIFFVHSNNILEKTKMNLSEKNCAKYLFTPSITIDDKRVDINVLSDFNDKKKGCINIHFSTVQSLFSLFKEGAKENEISIDDLAKMKLVLIADEAHHLNVETKKKKSKSDSDEIENWELVVNKIFNSNDKNLLLEFSATIPNESEIKEKYDDKIIFEYSLKNFCKDRYSKRISYIKYPLYKIENLFLGSLLSSYYRYLVGFDEGLDIKPVILFKSESINSSKENEEKFVKFLQSLNKEDIQSFYKLDLSDNVFLSKALAYFKNKWQDNTCDKLKESLQVHFQKEYILNANDKDIEAKKQILLNSLEQKDNLIKVIFAVDKLNEGWDVLNLFDIVRLANINSKQTSTKEAQLIGRGARYYPFLDRKDEQRYKRQYDDRLDENLASLENLIYHTVNDNAFIINLDKELINLGLIRENKDTVKILKPNSFIKEMIENDKIYYAKNSYEIKDSLFARKSIKEDLKNITVPLFDDNYVFSDSSLHKKEELSTSTDKIFSLEKIEERFFLKAMNSLALYFKDIHLKFELNENFTSKKEFITWLRKNIKCSFDTKQSFDSAEFKLEMAKYILAKYKLLNKKYTKKRKASSSFSINEFKAEERELLSSKNFHSINEFKAYEKWLFYDKFSIDNKKTKNEVEYKFLKFIDSNKKRLDEKFSKWFVLRNEGFEEFRFYNYLDSEEEHGKGFEPDFILFVKAKNKTYFSYECFIEAKGEHLIGFDSWKNEFLLDVKGKNVKAKDKNITLYGFPFFKNKNNDDFEKEFETFLSKFE